MDEYIFLTDLIYINKSFSLIAIIFVLYKCKPLMPKNPLKRIKAIKYILTSKQEEKNVISLPITGEIALKVSDYNFKIINLKEKAIYTVFNESNEKTIYEKLHYSYSSKMFEEIINVDKKNKIIKGVFYNGHHPNVIGEYLKLNRKFSDLFLELITKSEVKEVNVKNYAKTLYLDNLAVLERNSSIITEDHFNFVKNFILKKYEKIANEFLEDVIHLTLSHGDIKEDNLIVENNRFLLVDWEFCDFRIPSYDILQFMYRFPYFDPKFYQDLFGDVQKDLRSKDLSYKGLQKYFQNLGVNYLDLFYLEEIKLRLFQFERRSFAKDFSGYVVGYIKGIVGKS